MSGDTAAQGLARLPGVLKLRPDVLVVALGANDGLGPGSLEEAEAALGRIVLEARAGGARVLLVGIRLGVGAAAPRVGATAGDEERASRLFEIHARLAAAHRVRLVPDLLAGVAGEAGPPLPGPPAPERGRAAAPRAERAPAARARPGRGRGGERAEVRGVEQVPWLYDAGMVLLEKTGLGRWRRGSPTASAPAASSTSAAAPAATSRSTGEGVRAIGLDPCHESLLKARRRAPGVPLVRARAEALPFRDGAFDTVVSGLVFCSVADVPRGLAEVRRVLSPGGVLRMLEHVRARGRARRAAAGPHAAGVDVVHRRLPPQPRHRGRGRRRRVRRSTRPRTGPRATCGGSRRGSAEGPRSQRPGGRPPGSGSVPTSKTSPGRHWWPRSCQTKTRDGTATMGSADTHSNRSPPR